MITKLELKKIISYQIKSIYYSFSFGRAQLSHDVTEFRPQFGGSQMIYYAKILKSSFPNIAITLVAE